MIKKTTHRIKIHGSSEQIYAYLADATRWSTVFSPTIYAESEPMGPSKERLRIWATANGQVRSWASIRGLDPVARSITFEQESPVSPLLRMGGEWIVVPSPVGGSTVTLLHHYELQDSATDADSAFVEKAVDDNSEAELAALKTHIERVARPGNQYALTFTDEIHLEVSADEAFRFLDQADLWPQRLPHVASVKFERSGEIQHLSMVTTTPTGEPHETKSVRIAFPASGRLVYKQQLHPSIFLAHCGSWEIVPTGTDTCRASSTHSVVLNPDSPQLGSDLENLESVRGKVRHALGSNSLATLQQAASID